MKNIKLIHQSNINPNNNNNNNIVIDSESTTNKKLIELTNKSFAVMTKVEEVASNII